MTEPSTLPCGHSFCRACCLLLIERGAGQRLRCPLDRSVHPPVVPAPSVLLQALAEALRSGEELASPPPYSLPLEARASPSLHQREQLQLDHRREQVRRQRQLQQRYEQQQFIQQQQHTMRQHVDVHVDRSHAVRWAAVTEEQHSQASTDQSQRQQQQHRHQQQPQQNQAEICASARTGDRLQQQQQQRHNVELVDAR